MQLPLVFILYALFAMVFVVSKFGLEYTAPLFLVGSRMMFAGVLMLTYLFFFKREQFQFKKQHVIPFCNLALFNIYLTNACEFWGLKELSSAKTCFFYSLSPFLTALFAYFVIGEKMTSKKWGGLFLGFLGAVPIIMMGSDSSGSASFFRMESYAEFFVLGAVVFSVYGWVLLKQLCDGYQYSPFMANGVSMVLGGAVALVHSYYAEGWHPIPVTEWRPFFGSSVALIVLSNFVCYNLYGSLLRHYSSTFMSFAGFSTPLFTALFGWFFLGEATTWHLYASLGVIFTGLYLFHSEEIHKSLVPA